MDYGSESIIDSKPAIHFFFWDWRATLLMLTCLVLFWGNFDAPFYDKQEAREALVVWEINHSGNWILPLRNGNEIPSKPPLYHWIAAVISQSAHQLNEVTARLPSAILGSLGVLLVYFAGAILWDRSAGFIAGFILATSIEWWDAAKVARVDMTLTFALLCAFLFFFYVYRTGGGKNKAVILGCLLGLATLAKGPLGFVVPSFAYLIFLCLKRELSFIKKLHPFIIISACAVVAGSWYVLALWQGGRAFWEVVFKENFSMAIGREAGHPHPFYWYVPILFQKMAPWSLFFFPVAVWLCRSPRGLIRRDESLYLVVWTVVGFGFFSVFTQKRSVYILMIYPAVALLLGAFWQELKENPTGSSGLNWLSRPAAYLSATSFLILSGCLLFEIFGPGFSSILEPLLYSKDRAELQVLTGVLLEHRIGLLLWAVACGIGGALLILFIRQSAWGKFVGCTSALMVISLFFVQRFDVYLAQQYSFKDFMKRVVDETHHRPLYFYTSNDYGVEFYTDQRIPKLMSGGFEIGAGPYYVLVWEKEWKQLPMKTGLSILDRSNSIDRMGKGALLLTVSEDRSYPIHSLGRSLAAFTHRDPP